MLGQFSMELDKEFRDGTGIFEDHDDSIEVDRIKYLFCAMPTAVAGLWA